MYKERIFQPWLDGSLVLNCLKLRTSFRLDSKFLKPNLGYCPFYFIFWKASDYWQLWATFISFSRNIELYSYEEITSWTAGARTGVSLGGEGILKKFWKSCSGIDGGGKTEVDIDIRL